MMKREPRNILIIRFGSLGDVVLVTPFIEALRRRYPGCRISLAVKREYADLFADDHRVCRLFALGGGKGIGRERRTAGLLTELRRERFDLVVDLHRNARSILLSMLCHAGRHARYSTHRKDRHRLVRDRGGPGVPHIVERYLRALPELVEVVVDRRPHLVIGRDARQRADALLAAAGVQGGDLLIGLSIGAGRATKRWPAWRFAELGTLLVERLRARVVVVGDRSDEELAGLISEMMGGRAILAAGRTTLTELAALLERCRVVVANDSGPMHIATAVHTPVVALFGATTPELGFAPLGHSDIIISKHLGCRPCSLHGSERCPLGTFECMASIEGEEVFESVSRLLAMRQDRIPVPLPCEQIPSQTMGRPVESTAGK